jgi:hypothetical protein
MNAARRSPYRRPLALTALLAAVLLLTPIAPGPTANAEPAKAGDQVQWITDLPVAFARAKEKKLPLMICINAKFVLGRANREEPAAKGLREIVYLDPKIVTESRKFVCAFLSRGESGSGDYGELRALGIEGLIVSPQHIFVDPKGEKILERMEYWSYGSGTSAVNKLLEMMSKALSKLADATETPAEPSDPGAGAENAPAEGAPGPAPEAMPPGGDDAAALEERRAWITTQLGHVTGTNASKRESSLENLVRNDREGDCIDPLIALVGTSKDNVELLVPLIRVLGRDKLTKAAAPIAAHLGHKDDRVRGNAAVSLEYIGCPDSVGDLKKRASKEKNVAIANHIYRAMGRCGAGDSKVRGVLIKKIEKHLIKDVIEGVGPAIGLAYFENDKKTARATEKLFQKASRMTGGRRGGGGGGTFMRGVLGWVISEVGDEKSAKFIQEEMLDPLENSENRWVRAVKGFYQAIIKKLEGDEGAMDTIQGGVRRSLEWGGPEELNLQDESRQNRDTTEFQPKGEWLSAGGT